MSLIATAPASSAAPRHLGREGVGRDRQAGAPARPAIAGRERRGLVLGGDRRAAAGGDGADVEHVEARLGQRPPVGDRLLGGAAARALEHRVGGDVDDPGGRAAARARASRSASRQAGRGGHRGYRSGRRMALRCVYTDLDGTLLGRGGSLFRDAEGDFSMLQARALEACHRAGVEVVIMSGRREPQVLEDARLMGQTSYIYEAGCAVMIDGETTILTGDFAARRGRHGLRADRGPRGARAALRALPRPARVPRALAHGPRPLAPLPRQGRRRRGQRAARTSDGHDDLRLLDNGAIGRQMDGDRGPRPRLPPGPARRSARRTPSPSTRGPAATTPRSASRSATRSRTSRSPPSVGRFFVVANGPERDAGPARGDRPAATTSPSPRARWATAFYEAVVSTLMGAERPPGRPRSVAARGRGAAAHRGEQAVGEPRGHPVEAEQARPRGARRPCAGRPRPPPASPRRRPRPAAPRPRGASRACASRLVGVQVGRDLAGEDRRHRDPGARELVAQRLGEVRARPPWSPRRPRAQGKARRPAPEETTTMCPRAAVEHVRRGARTALSVPSTLTATICSASLELDARRRGA